jgi:MoaA/NifB/PqqE/SkfB family radical SAM enzyme
MNEQTEYLNNAVEGIFHQALKASVKNPLESAFIAKFILSQSENAKKRRKAEESGHHIPPFLIASITSQCNLHCEGCYARANNACGENFKQEELTTEQWKQIFREASELGISFILLAGGEPLMRTDVLQQASLFQNIIFPVFTNGTLFDQKAMGLFEFRRNLIPIFSMEGDSVQTDERRGEGISSLLNDTIEQMKRKGIFYGVSITVTSQNLQTVTSDDFIASLSRRDCKLVLFVEYVPAQESTASLTLSGGEREQLAARQKELKTAFGNMVFLSFPGDEKSAGGCLAAGRGFFHINAAGGAEPCPFSPFSDTSLKDHSLMEALQSPLFQKLQSANLLQADHRGGCTLFDQQDAVKNILSLQA